MNARWIAPPRSPPVLAVKAAEDVHRVLMDNSAVGGAWRRDGSQAVGAADLQLAPRALVKVALPEVVFVFQVGVGVNVARVAAKDVHCVVEHHSRMVVARARRLPSHGHTAERGGGIGEGG